MKEDELSWTGLNSSNLFRTRYNRKEVTLDIEFKNGGQYRYSGVPQKIFDGITKAESPGKYFFAHIKGKFDAVNLNPKEKEDVGSK